MWHTVTAGLFLAAASSYALRAAFVAMEVYSSASLFIIRMALSGIMFLAICIMLFFMLPKYYVSAGRFNKHYRPLTGAPTPLPADEELALRNDMALLAYAQVLWGLSYTILIITGAAEAADLPGGAEAVAGGIVAAVAGCAAATVAGLLLILCHCSAIGDAQLP